MDTPEVTSERKRIECYASDVRRYLEALDSYHEKPTKAGYTQMHKALVTVRVTTQMILRTPRPGE